jgi:hypothetical protein
VLNDSLWWWSVLLSSARDMTTVVRDVVSLVQHGGRIFVPSGSWIVEYLSCVRVDCGAVVTGVVILDIINLEISIVIGVIIVVILHGCLPGVDLIPEYGKCMLV